MAFQRRDDLSENIENFVCHSFVKPGRFLFFFFFFFFFFANGLLGD